MAVCPNEFTVNNFYKDLFEFISQIKVYNFM